MLHGYMVGIVVMLIGLLFVSLVLSIYAEGVEGLLTPRGIRWICSNIVANFASVPLAQIMLGLMAVSVVRESGILGTISGHMSMKQKRALQITGIAVFILVSLFLLLLLMPDAILLSAFGTVSNSAFTKGSFGLACCMAILVGNVYGYTSGRFVTIRDHVHAHISVFYTIGGYFVLLFLSSQFICCMEFTGILPFLGDDGTMLTVLKGLLYDLPLIFYIFLSL